MNSLLNLACEIHSLLKLGTNPTETVTKNKVVIPLILSAMAEKDLILLKWTRKILFSFSVCMAFSTNSKNKFQNLLLVYLR